MERNPLSWYKLASAVNTKETALFRSKECELRYTELRKKRSVLELQKELFSGPSVDMRFTWNPVPYHLEDDISHGIIWLNPLNSFQNAYRSVKVRLHTLPFEWMLYENPPQYKSVPEIIHFHIFTLRGRFSTLEIEQMVENRLIHTNVPYSKILTCEYCDVSFVIFDEWKRHQQIHY